ncbi:Ldh family oxidoreductase [Microbacterium aurantiacum]
MNAPESYPVPAAVLREYCASIFVDAGVPAADAELVADSLVEANLRGVDSHGVSRVPIYIERIRRGLTDPDPDVRVVSERGGALLIDGDNGMGQVVTQRAVDVAFDRLSEQRVVSVGIRNSNHYGAGAYFGRRAAERGAAVFLYGNAPSTMVAWGGRERFLGTNPYTFAVPAGDRAPVVLDMATSVVARGKIILSSQLGQDIPEGWAVDVAGQPTTEAAAALEGSVLPFGGPKGYGIALMIEIMAAVLSGANCGPEVGDLYDELERPQGVGAFLNLTDITAFQPLSGFGDRITGLIDAIKLTAAEGSEVLIPGELEQRVADARLRDGVPVPPAVAAALEKVAAKPFPTDNASQTAKETHEHRPRP